MNEDNNTRPLLFIYKLLFPDGAPAIRKFQAMRDSRNFVGARWAMRTSCRSARALGEQEVHVRARDALGPSFVLLDVCAGHGRRGGHGSVVNGERLVRYTWLWVFEPAKIRLPGVDVVVRGQDGRIATLTSFFGTLESIEVGAPARTQKPWSP